MKYHFVVKIILKQFFPNLIETHPTHNFSTKEHLCLDIETMSTPNLPLLLTKSGSSSRYIRLLQVLLFNVFRGSQLYYLLELY